MIPQRTHKRNLKAFKIIIALCYNKKEGLKRDVDSNWIDKNSLRSRVLGGRSNNNKNV